MRIDEFKKTASGAISASDRMRFALVGFDKAGAAPPVINTPSDFMGQPPMGLSSQYPGGSA